MRTTSSVSGDIRTAARVMFLVFIVLVGTPTIFCRYLSDLTLPATPNDQRQQSTETKDVTAAKKCLSSGKILYENRCHQLLTEGPCGYGQWLVLDDRWDGGGGDDDDRTWRRPGQDERTPPPSRLTEPTAKCARRRCTESDVYWPRDGFCYDADTADRRRLCPGANTALVTDEFGDGRCACADGDGEVPNVRLSGRRRRGDDGDGDEDGDEDARPCYKAYTRGPCRRGHVIVPFAPGYGNCTLNRCAEERHWPQQQQQQQQEQQQQEQQQQEQQQQEQQQQEQQQQEQQQQQHQQQRQFRWPQQQQQQQQLRRQQRQQQESRDGTPLAPWTDGLCYELGSRGPCADQEKFSVARADGARPACVANAALQLDLFSDKGAVEAPMTPSPSQDTPPPACKTDHTGQCVEGVDVTVEDSEAAFRKKLQESAMRHAQRDKERKKKRTPHRKN